MIKLNPDKEKVKEIREKIASNGGYCCCRLEKIDVNKCPCLDFRENFRCICDLYVNIEEENNEKI